MLIAVSVGLEVPKGTLTFWQSLTLKFKWVAPKSIHVRIWPNIQHICLLSFKLIAVNILIYNLESACFFYALSDIEIQNESSKINRHLEGPRGSSKLQTDCS